MIDESEAVEETEAVTAESDNDAELTDALVEVAETEETATDGQLSPKKS